MKKVFILFVLLALPIIIYIIFATAVHQFSYLPVLTENVKPLTNFTSLEEDDELTFDDTVTVLLYFGESIKDRRGNAYNLHEKIYKKNYIYKDFQFIVVAEDGTQNEAKELLDQLHDFTDINVSKWKFAFGSLGDIQELFDSMQSNVELDKKHSTHLAFVVDKDGNLRGRKENEEEGEEVLYGYDSKSIAALNNTLVDDINILLAEYRLKQSQEERDILKHDK